MTLTESIVEDAALTWFGELGYVVGHGAHLAPGEQAGGTLTPALFQGERESRSEVVRVGTPSLVQTHRAFHRLLRDGELSVAGCQSKLEAIA